VGLQDDPSGFDPTPNPRLAAWWRQRPGLRLAGSGVVWQELLFVMLGQRVTTVEAMRSWGRIVSAWGEPAPGPCELQLPPSPGVVAGRTYVDLHRFNVERRRADAILLAARRAARLEEAATMDAVAAYRRLSALPGLGPWTATSVITMSHGDPDTIVLRDYGLPTVVNHAFTGDARRVPPDEGGDELMCRHLAPWAGHRQRVVRLIVSAGRGPRRRAPRAFNPDIRRL
jgi:3-methyladenine DNA glycosylase/8-oxoguanine DNA glycosylase